MHSVLLMNSFVFLIYGNCVKIIKIKHHLKDDFCLIYRLTVPCAGLQTFV